MKLLIFTIAVGIYLVQACLAAPRTYTDADVEDIGFESEGDVDLEAKLAESIMATLKKYKNNPLGLFSLALQGDACSENGIDLMHIVAVANNKTDEEIMTKYNEGVIPALNFTDEQLKVIEVDLVKHHSPEKAPHAMTILRGFQIRGSRRELESFEITFLMAAAKADNYGCPSENSQNNEYMN